jgi:hypothetical protein
LANVAWRKFLTRNESRPWPQIGMRQRLGVWQFFAVFLGHKPLTKRHRTNETPKTGSISLTVELLDDLSEIVLADVHNPHFAPRVLF